MANFRKSFNLRNGVQVDDDNFIVNANGLVGIGTSSPIEILDVRGNTRIVGLLTASTINTPSLAVTGFGTFGTITDGTVRISSGIITGITTTGIVTFYGDGRGLINIPTSQWIDIDPGIGATSIYASGRVGIATTNPIQPYFLHIGGNPNSTVGPNTGGVGINSTGNIKASGIITASTYFSGLHFGEVNSTGISTFTIVRVGTGTNPPTVMTSGVITSTQFVGTLVGIATSALSLTGNPSIGVATVTSVEIRSGIATVGIITVLTELDVGIGGTAFTALNSGFVGIGTANPNSQLQIRKASNSLLEVISDTGGARISVGQSIGIGKSTGVIRFGTASRTFEILNNDIGNLSMYIHAGVSGVNTGRFTWNYGQTNAELAAITHTGRLGLGITNPIETLHVVGTSTITNDAYFGNNITVVNTIEANSGIFTDLTLNGGLLNGANLNVYSGLSTVNSIDFFGNILGLAGTSFVGIGTSNFVGVDTSVTLWMENGRASFGSLVISRTGTNAAQYLQSGNLTLDVDGVMAVSDGIGIGTTVPIGGQLFTVVGGTGSLVGTGVSFINADININNKTPIGIGTTAARAAVDFGQAGKGFTAGAGTSSPFAAMIVPIINNATERAGLNTVSNPNGFRGAIIYDMTISKFRGWTGTAWVDFH